MSDYILIDGTLYHHGIKGQKWGLRRWQNEDGSLTPAGREHYGYGVVGNTINSIGQIGGRRYTTSGKKIKYRRKDEKSFISEKSKLKKVVRGAVAVSSLGTGRFSTRFAYNHRTGLRVANGLLTTAFAGTQIALLGPAALPSVALTVGSTIVSSYAGEKINDAMYENLYLKDKSNINQKYRDTRKSRK